MVRPLPMNVRIDILSAQPSLDAKQVQRNKFTLAMSVGKSRDYPVFDIGPRHFVQTTEQAGIGKAFVNAVFDDLANDGAARAAKVIDALRRGLPEAMTVSIMKGLSHRLGLITDYVAKKDVADG